MARSSTTRKQFHEIICASTGSALTVCVVVGSRCGRTWGWLPTDRWLRENLGWWFCGGGGGPERDLPSPGVYSLEFYNLERTVYRASENGKVSQGPWAGAIKDNGRGPVATTLQLSWSSSLSGCHEGDTPQGSGEAHKGKMEGRAELPCGHIPQLFLFVKLILPI